VRRARAPWIDHERIGRQGSVRVSLTLRIKKVGKVYVYPAVARADVEARAPRTIDGNLGFRSRPLTVISIAINL